jgi:hypothetical protein
MVGGHVLKDGRRLGVLYASLTTTVIVNALYEKLLVVKETDAEGNIIERERRTTVNPAIKTVAGPLKVELIMSIPGIKNLSAHVIVSEIGIDMSRFPSAAHLTSWACICPCNDESAGKRRSIVSVRAPIWLKTTLVQYALAAARKKGTYMQAQFYRLKAPARPQEGDHGCRRLHPHRHRPHAQGRHDVSGPRLRPFQAPHHRPAKKSPVKRLSDLGCAVEQLHSLRHVVAARPTKGPAKPEHERPIACQCIPCSQRDLRVDFRRGAFGARRVCWLCKAYGIAPLTWRSCRL